MLYPPTPPSNESTFIILSCWNDFFSSNTPIAERPRLLDSLGIIEELHAIAARCQTDSRWEKHIQDVACECEEIAHRDPIIKKYYSSTYHALSEISKSSGSNNIRKITGAAINTLHNYHESIKKYLLEDIERLPRNKNDIVNGLNILATRAHLLGIEDSQLSNINYDYETQSTKDAISSILSSTKTHKSKYTCLIFIIDPDKCARVILEQLGIKILAKHHKPSSKLYSDIIEQIRVENTNYIVACVDVLTYGIDAATRESVSMLQNAIDIANFCLSRRSTKIHNKMLIESNSILFAKNSKPSERTTTLDKKTNTNNYIRKVLSAGIENFPTNLTNALEQYSIALKSNDTKSRFSNIWVALESLCASTDPTVISNILSALTPTLTLKRVQSALKNLAIHLNNQNALNLPNALEYLPKSKTSGKPGIIREELALLLTGASGNLAQKLFCDDLSINPFLRYKLTILSNEINTPKAFLKRTKESRTRHDWQIKRIYRARNALFHSGESTLHTPYLLDNLRYYFISATFAIFESIIRNGPTNTDETLFQQNMHLENLIHKLKNCPSSIVLSDVIPYCDHFKSRSFFPSPPEAMPVEPPAEA